VLRDRVIDGDRDAPRRDRIAVEEQRNLDLSTAAPGRRGQRKLVESRSATHERLRDRAAADVESEQARIEAVSRRPLVVAELGQEPERQGGIGPGEGGRRDQHAGAAWDAVRRRVFCDLGEQRALEIEHARADLLLHEHHSLWLAGPGLEQRSYLVLVERGIALEQERHRA
jgi:hypothetical protein